ncbi:Ubiquitin-like domain-containing protein, partial [Durusdinium trenchii]
GPATGTKTKAVWVRQLQKDGEKVELVGNAFQVLGELANVDLLKKDQDKFKQIGNAFQVKGELANVDDLKEAIEKKEKLSIAASKIDIYSSKDGKWIREDEEASVNRGTSKSDCYGFTIPSSS